MNSVAFLHLCSEHDSTGPFDPFSCLALHSNCCLQEAREEKKLHSFQLNVFLLVFTSTSLLSFCRQSTINLYMCDHFVFDWNILGFTYPYCIKSVFHHPMERIFFYTKCFCTVHMVETFVMTSAKFTYWVTFRRNWSWLFILTFSFYVYLQGTVMCVWMYNP